MLDGDGLSFLFHQVGYNLLPLLIARLFLRLDKFFLQDAHQARGVCTTLPKF